MSRNGSLVVVGNYYNTFTIFDSNTSITVNLTNISAGPMPTVRPAVSAGLPVSETPLQPATAAPLHGGAGILAAVIVGLIAVIRRR
jgi:hypothetical protein